MIEPLKPIGVGFKGKLVSDYIELAEWPVVALVGVVILIYLTSLWLEMSYYGLIVPLVFLTQVLAAAGLAYWRGVINQEAWPQVIILTALVGLVAGLVSAMLALFRFWHFWLIFNLVTEPVWSASLAIVVSLLTLGFFHLPGALRPWFNKIKK